MATRYFGSNQGDNNDDKPEGGNKRSSFKGKHESRSKSKDHKMGFDRKSFFGKDKDGKQTVEIHPDKLKKYSRGTKLDPFEASRVVKFRKKLKKQEIRVKESVRWAARSELLLPEESGYLEADDGEETYQVTQKEIIDSVDITSASKHFDLRLDEFGPYEVSYFRNGRQLLIGGKHGHVAAFDWMTKELMCEFNVRESVHAVEWLQMPNMFAVAQKDWVHLYDDKAIEIHCLKKLYRIMKMDFLPYHYLLTTCSDNGYLSWLDVSVGKMINNFRMKHMRVTSMKHNPHNAVTFTSHPNGVVALWSPNQRESLASMLCHPAAIRDIAINNDGKYLATVGVDRAMRLWDLRNYKCLQNYRLHSIPGVIDISQKDLISVSLGDVVQVYKDCFNTSVDKPYMRHRIINSNIRSTKFCNYEDVLGIGHDHGFTSILVPGSGEPNFDAFESNPYMAKSQRREMEVKSLLDKIQPETICLDPNELLKVDVSTIKSNLEQKKKLNFVKDKQVEFESGKKKTRTKSAKKTKIKKGLKDQAKRAQVKQIVKEKKGWIVEEKKQEKKNVLDRFASKS